MQRKGMSLAVLIVATILIAGCTSQPVPIQPSISVATTVPQPTAPAPEITISPTVPAPVPATQVIVQPKATATSSPDLLFHRWVNTSGNYKPEGWTGAEIKLYPDGSLVFNSGLINEISSNVIMKSITQSWTGTWTRINNDTYIGKFSPTGTAQTAPEILDIKYYPRSERKEYPGSFDPERIFVDKTMFVRAKID